MASICGLGRSAPLCSISSQPYPQTWDWNDRRERLGIKIRSQKSFIKLAPDDWKFAASGEKGATTFSKMTLSITIFSITTLSIKSWYVPIAECMTQRYGELRDGKTERWRDDLPWCWVSLCTVSRFICCYAECYSDVILLFIMLSVIMLNVVMLSVIMLSAVMLSAFMLNVVTLNVVMPSVIMLSVVMLSVVMLNVVAPKKCFCHQLLRFCRIILKNIFLRHWRFNKIS